MAGQSDPSTGENIRKFLQQHENFRTERSVVRNTEFASPVHGSPSSVAPGSRRVRHRPGYGSMVPSLNSSSATMAIRRFSDGSDVTESHSMFDQVSISNSSVSSVPTQYPAPLLPCEFACYHGCDRFFSAHYPDEVADHIINDHLTNSWGIYIPEKTVCWFCDAIEFVSQSSERTDKVRCFRERTRHNCKHFLDGWTANDMRPDFHFLDFLHRNSLVSDEMFRLAIGYSELPNAVGQQAAPSPYDNNIQDETMIPVNHRSISTRRRATHRHR